MAKLEVLAGTTSKVAYVFIQDSSKTDGSGLTGLVFGSGSLVASYVRPGAARVAITLATQTVTGAWSSGGFIEVDSSNCPGLYRLDLPDAALAASAKSVIIMLKGATNMAPCVMEIELTVVDNQSASYGLTNLDATISSRASSSALSTVQADTDDIQTRLPAALVSGRIDASVGAMAANVLTATAIAADAITAAKVADGTIDAATFAAGAIDAAAIATDAIGSAELAASAVAKIQTSVTAGAVASVTGAVGSVTAGVTVTTNNDKTGYGLSAAAVQAVWDALTSVLTTAGSIGKRLADDIDATVSSRLATSGYTAPDNADIVTILARTDVATSTRSSHSAADVWAVGTRALTDKAGFALSSAGVQAIWDALTSALTTASSVGKLLVDNVNATISSRLASSAYVDHTSAIAAVQADTDDLQTRVPTALVSGRMNSSVQAMATDVLDAAALKTDAAAEVASAVRTELTTELARVDAAVSTRSAPATAQTISLTTALNTSSTGDTIGGALLAARAQGFGKWAITGTSLVLYAADGSTVVRTFTLDSATTPTSRT